MGRKALIAVVCYLTISATLGKTEDGVTSVIIDNISEGSAPRLYRNVPTGIYASAAPYADYSFHIPRFITAPKAAASRIIPVREQYVVHNPNSFLKDSYGNRFVGTPQYAYKSSFPQQFLQLQELPVHLVQPLPAAGTSYQIKQASPQIIYGSQYRSPAAVPSSVNHFAGFSQPVSYAQNIQSLAPTQKLNTQVHSLIAPAQQSTSNSAVFANTHNIEKYSNVKNEPKFQRLEESPKVHHVEKVESEVHVNTNQDKDKEQLQESPGTQSYTTIVNGQKTVINLETKPPIPLLDLTLLEPLHFDNPVVPQVQHFLPRINQATYQKLPKFNLENTKQKKSGIENDNERPHKKTSKKKNKKPTQHGNTYHQRVPVQPTITITSTPNDAPEISYEINSPNYKETYKEQVVSYNKETKPEPVNINYEHKTVKEPVTYSYGNIVQSKPVHYTYVHSSKKPMQSKEVSYERKDQPQHLIYTFNNDESSGENSDTPRHSSPHSESGEANSSEENDDDEQNYQPQHEEYEEPPKHGHQLRPEHREEQYHYVPKQELRDNVPRKSPPSTAHVKQQIQLPVQHEVEYHPITKEYEEDIRLIPTQNPNAAIKVDPNQHVQRPALQVPHQNHNPSPTPLILQHRPSSAPHINQQHPNQHPSPVPEIVHQHYHSAPEQRHKSNSVPLILEKSKHIIIQEETPEEMHSHREKIMAQMEEQEENNEEDFEKAYKGAAYGFPAYEKSAEDIEKDIYNSESYGVPRDAGYHVDHTPFQVYQAEGDSFPKSARLKYKDTSDVVKNDYYSDYAVSKPESLEDHHKKKQEYYKTYNKYKPEKYFSNDNHKNNNNQKEKYTVAPTFTFGPAPKQNKGYFAQYKASPQKHHYEYDYSKETPRNEDSSAHASRPYQRYKSKTHFVEPQFQYGFEPISLPRLLDSELAAMATNHSPESEKPGMRKKLYKENWYIKKTSTAGGKPAR